MSIQDDINRLRALGSSDRIPMEKIRALQADLVELNAEVASILGEGHGFYHGIGTCAAQVSQKLDDAIAACMEYEDAIHDAADRLEQGGQ